MMKFLPLQLNSLNERTQQQMDHLKLILQYEK